MKVIFLDHDGVICLYDNWGSRLKKQKEWGGRKLSMGLLEIPLEYRFDNFDQKAVKVLNEILEETGAEIVVSSFCSSRSDSHRSKFLKTLFMIIPIYNLYCI